MSNHPPDDPKEISGVLKRVHQLGTTTDRLFSRLYSGLNRRARLQEERDTLVRQQQIVDLKLTQAKKIREDNRELRQTLGKQKTEIERLHGILGSLEEGIIIQELDGRITMINEAAQKLLGSQKNFWDTQLGTLFNEYREVDMVTSELMPLGDTRQIQINNRILCAQLAAISDNGIERTGTIIILSDVTRDALAERLKDGFVTHISHELKTPMTVIKLASEMLAGLPEDAPVNQKMLTTLTRNVDVLNRLVLELLDISEMNAGTFEIKQEPLHVEATIWQAVNSLSSELVDAQLQLTVMTRDVDRLYVLGDETRLQWALEHLLRNSISYNEAGGRIMIAAALNQDKHAVIKVRDTGAGISDKDIPHIFERFYRGEARTHEGKRLDPRGLGQGLYVAQTISEAHGGYITVDSSAGEGSEFTMTLPASSYPELSDQTSAN